MYVVRLRGLARVATSAALICFTLAMTSSASAQCERQHVQADVPRPNDWFGNTVAISGDWAAAGLYTDPTNGAGSGAVLMYHRDAVTGSWTQVQKIIPADNQAGDGFGTRVSMDEDVLVVSARWDDDAGNAAGSIYVYRLNNTSNQWVFEAKRTASDATPLADFGSCLDVRGDLIVVGADGSSSQSSLDSKAYIFERDAIAGWTQTASLQSTDPIPTKYAIAVASDGISVFVSGRGGEDYSPPIEWVDIFERDAVTGAWTRIDQLMNPSGQVGQAFGWTTDIDDGTALIGCARYELGIGFWLGGHIYHRDSKAEQWFHETRLDAAIGTNLSFWEVRHMALDGDTAVFGLLFPPGNASGRALVLRRETPGSWIQIADIDAAGPLPTTIRYAFGVALDGNQLILGAPDFAEFGSTNNASGHVYFVDLDNPDCNLNSMCDDLDVSGGTSSDINTNGVPDECEIQGDISGDGHVDVVDLLAVTTTWGPCPPAPADCGADIAPLFVGDNVVDVNDLHLVIINWGSSLP